MAEVVSAIKGIRKGDIIIAFMGPTGAGKSYFIDLLTGQQSQRAGLTPVTREIKAIRVKHPLYGDRVVLVDTPGFGDTTRSDMQILQMISDWLQKTYGESVMLDGLIYLNRITDNRMTGSPYKNLRMFERLCGDAELNQVILVSTMWEKVRHATGEAREQELVNKFWKVLIDKGSRVNRLEKNTTDLAWTIVDQLIQDREGKEALLLQKELEEVGNKLKERTDDRGMALSKSFQNLLAAQREFLGSLEEVGLGSVTRLHDMFKELLNKIIAGFKAILRKIRQFGIQLGRWIMALFFGQRTRAENTEISVEV